MKTLFTFVFLLHAMLSSFGQSCVDIECFFGESQFALLNESCSSGNNCVPNATLKTLTVNHLKHHSFWFRVGQANHETRLNSPIVQYNPHKGSEQCVKLIYDIGNDINLIVFYWIQHQFSGTENNPTMRGAIINWQVNAVNCSSINDQEINLFANWDFDLSANSVNDRGDLIVGSNSAYLLQKDFASGDMVLVEASSINLVGVLVNNASFICSILDDIYPDNLSTWSQPQSECDDTGVVFQWRETIPANTFLLTIAAGSGIVYLNTPAADFNGDYCVDDDDLLLLLLAYGQQCSVFDLDNSGTVDDMDILELLFSYSGDCLTVSAACVSCVWDIKDYCK